jgi:hypothetical protein
MLSQADCKGNLAEALDTLICVTLDRSVARAEPSPYVWERIERQIRRQHNKQRIKTQVEKTQR